MIFLDSSYLIGLLIKKDSHVNKSLKIESIIEDESKLINNAVFNEVLNSLTPNNSDYTIDDSIELLLSFDIDFLTSKDYDDTVESFKYYNHGINFSDCTILHSMAKNKVDTIVSFDADFDKINGIRRISD